MSKTALPIILLTLICGASNCVAAAPAVAQASGGISPSLITTPVNEAHLVKLSTGTHPLLSFATDQGPVADSLQLDHVLLQLRRSPAQQAALDALVQSQSDRSSPNYHHWLTAAEYGSYGASEQDIDTVVSWLSGHGIQVNSVHANRLTIDVSATAAQVYEAFHTEMHRYLLNGVEHIANASSPSVPAAIAPALTGVVSLNNFLPKPAVISHPKKSFSFPSPFGEQYDEAPGDFATIYNVSPLYKGDNPITGKGQTVVVLEVTDIHPKDVATFRSAFGLSKYAGKFLQIHPGVGCKDPGFNGDEIEAALDAEWAGVAAPDANVVLASCADTTTNFGAFIAAQNLLDEPNPPSIMSLSYLECEANSGPGGNAYVGTLWEQAYVEGVSVFVAAGDNGAAGCDDPNVFPTWAVEGVQANGLASTPFNVAAGGTDFLDTAEGTNLQYWATSNGPTGVSALSYIPEMPWNDSCASRVLAQYFGAPNGYVFCNSNSGQNFLDITGGSGSPSFVWAKPFWQKNIAGIATDGARDLPDISLFASNGFWNHAILFCMSDKAHGGTPCDYSNPADTFANSAGGTSFTAPQFAGIQALINQKAGAAQGDPNPILYALARAEYGVSGKPHASACNSSLGSGVAPSCIFHDVTEGNNAVPCYGKNSCFGSAGFTYGVLSTSDTLLKPAYMTQEGWDFATGLGSVNVANLVNAWP